MTAVEFERWVKFQQGGRIPPGKHFQDWWAIKYHYRQEILETAKVRLPRLPR